MKYKLIFWLLLILGFRNLYSTSSYFINTWSSLLDQGLTYKYLILSLAIWWGFALVPLMLAACFAGLLAIREDDSISSLLAKAAWGGLLSYICPPIIIMGWFMLIVWAHRFVA